MASPGQESESLHSQFLVDSMPAMIHTARLDGYLDCFNKRWLEYAVLLVDPEDHPPPTLDVAPTQGGLVALVKIVKGTETPQFAPTGSLKFSGYDRVPLLESWQMEDLGL